MPKKSFGEQINSAQMMMSGLQNNSAEAKRRGIDTGQIAQLIVLATTTNNEQEKLKASLKVKIAALDVTMKDLAKKMSNVEKIIKTDFPKEQWKEFGILDKK